MYNFDQHFGIPGQTAPVEEVASAFGLTFSSLGQLRYLPKEISGAARDAGNTGYTDVLRPGLLLGAVFSSSELMQWDPAAVDGTQRVAGVLVEALKMTQSGANANRFIGRVLVGGGINAKALQIASLTTRGIVGADEEYNIRAQMHPGFCFDDDPMGNLSGKTEGVITLIAAATTLSAAHTGSTILAAGTAAMTLTLPTTPKKGLRFKIYNTVDQNLILTAAANTMIIFDDVAATSVALQTAGDLVGGCFEVFGTGTKWAVMPILWGSDGVLVQTITSTT